MGQQFQSVDVYFILQYWILSLDGTVKEGKIGTVFLPAQDHGETESGGIIDAAEAVGTISATAADCVSKQ